MKFFWFIFLFPLSVLAQQPSHYTIGERELEGEHIYDILQASNGEYWITSNNGLIKFDGYTFERQSCVGILTPSLFNLIEDSKGNIYCFNLAGQIFRVQDGLCEPYFTLPDSLVAANMDMEVDNLNQLLIMASRVVVIDSNQTSRVLPFIGTPGSSYLGEMTKMPDESIWGSPSLDGQMLIWKDNRLEVKTISNLSYKIFEPYHVINLGGRILLNYNGTTGLLELVGNITTQIGLTDLPRSEDRVRLHQVGDKLWFLGGTTGAYRLDKHLNCMDNDEPIFPNTFISAIIQDSENNTLLGTFGNGIIVIPDGSATDLSQIPKDEKVVSIASDNDGIIYFGSQLGNLYKFDSTGVNLFRHGQKSTIENLFYLEEGSLLFTDVRGVKLDLSSGKEQDISLGSLKDVFQRTDGSYLLASNHGSATLEANTHTVDRRDGIEVRLHAIGESPTTNTIYACSSKGLILRKKDSQTFLDIAGENVIGRDVATDGTYVFVATDARGILVFQNDSLVETWDKSNGLISDRIRQIKFLNDQLFASTDKGIQILTPTGAVLKTITRSEGLYANNIRKFELVGNVLWVVHNKGVQSIHLDQIEPFTFQPTIELARIEVNDSLIDETKIVRFGSDQTRFSFKLRSRALRYQNEIKYRFKLEGADKNWQEVDHQSNLIEYRSLSSGTYKFQAIAICRGKESLPIEYRFTIATPFYNAWWFYALLSLGLILGVVLWFKSRLKRQTFLSEQQNELNASKLTAIQSQMNPHFIFNALNSIQDLVLKGDVTNSYTYITKFADLVRRTLNYSDKDFIDFENELKLIELYLTLEKLRFKTDFEFTIDASGVEDIQLPPMLVQPFIENALVHGLLHREGAKKLDLKFELNDHLVCTITDNGVGRKKAREIKERQRSNHESFSVNAIRNRFEILQRNFGGNLGFTTEDLKEDGEPVGTCVKLVIPIKRKY